MNIIMHIDNKDTKDARSIAAFALGMQSMTHSTHE